MNIVVNFSKQADKFLKKNPNSLTRKKTLELVSISIRILILHEDLNLDLKALKGEYKGYFRIRNIRIIFMIKENGDLVVVDIHAIDYRGNVY
jgi:mRNA-degrading endonuclease RelE of RelBE toxin-antitoxin system